MKTTRKSFIRKMLIDQRGQSAAMLAIGIFALMGLGGLTIDVGRAYSVRTQVQNAAQIAALAGAPQVYASPSNAISVARQYSADPSTGLNYKPGMGAVTTTITTPCINAIMVAPATCSNSGDVPNAVRVVESTVVQTYFGAVFGVKTLNVTATATAVPTGVKPSNIAIILDATPSMNNTDPNCSGLTDEACAMSGIQSFLELLRPCALGQTSCNGSDGKTFTRVSMFSFPNVAPGITSGTVWSDYGSPCNGGTAKSYPYTLPTVGAVGYTPVKYSGATSGSYGSTFTATYQVTPATVGDIDQYGFTSQFYDSTQTNSMNKGSILVQEIGNGVASPCLHPPTSLADAPGYSSSNGETYLAGAIYAAQSALVAEKAKADALLNPLGLTSQNAIIVVSDGQMNTNKGMFPVGWGTTSATNGINAMNSNGVYPSYIDACQQAMQAGQYAHSQGTQVYGVAYGAESGGCTPSSGVDSTVISPLPYGAYNISIGSTGAIVPCVTMENIADSMLHFYAEISSVGCSTTGTNAPMTHLATIFNAIAGDLGISSRLIPNSIT
jgi:Flp pilus assembly protein TadG